MPDSKYAVFIPVKNEEQHVEKCLDSILASAKENVVIHIYNDKSTDRTPELLAQYGEKYPHVKVGEGFGQGPGKVRNHFLREHQYDYVIYLDGDIKVKDNWFEEVQVSLKHMDDEIISVGGAQHIPESGNSMERFHGALLESLSFLSDHIKQTQDIIEVTHNPLCNVIYRFDKIKEVGGFDESIFPGEDLDLDIRLQKAGYRFKYNPNMIVYHHRPDTVREFQTMLKKYGTTQAYLLKKHGLTQKLQLVPLITLLCFLGVILVPKALLVVMFAMFLFFAIRTNNLLFGVTFPFYALVSLASWNFGFIKGLFTAKPEQTKHF